MSSTCSSFEPDWSLYIFFKSLHKWVCLCGSVVRTFLADWTSECWMRIWRRVMTSPISYPRRNSRVYRSPSGGCTNNGRSVWLSASHLSFFLYIFNIRVSLAVCPDPRKKPALLFHPVAHSTSPEALSALFHIRQLRDAHDWLVLLSLTGEEREHVPHTWISFSLNVNNVVCHFKNK